MGEYEGGSEYGEGFRWMHLPPLLEVRTPSPPPPKYAPEDRRVTRRAVRMLLECILIVYTIEGKRAGIKRRGSLGTSEKAG